MTIIIKNSTPYPTSSTCSKMSGFTLIEVLIAITIFSVGVLAVVTMQTTSVNGNAKARQISEGTLWASDQMEQLLERDYALFVDGGGTNNGTAGLNDGGITASTTADSGAAIISSDGSYSTYWNVAVDQPAANLKTIRVIVKHNSANTPPVTMDFIKNNAI